MVNRMFINVSVEWFGVPDFHSINGPAWTADILAPRPSWVDVGSTTNPNWGSKPSGPYGSVAVPWSGPVRVMPAYVRRSTENTRATARHIHENHP